MKYAAMLRRSAQPGIGPLRKIRSFQASRDAWGGWKCQAEARDTSGLLTIPDAEGA